MVIQRRLLNLAAGVLTAFLMSAMPAHAQVPTPQEVKELGAKVTEDLEALDKSMSAENFSTLKGDLEKFKALVAAAGQAVDSQLGGAVTPKAAAAVDAVAQTGVDIANAMFVFRTEKEAKLKQTDREQAFEDLMVNEVEFPMLQMAFKGLRDKVDERDNIDGKTNLGDVFRRTFMEVGRGVVAAVRFGKNRATGEFYYHPRATYRREQMTRKLISTYQEYARAHIPEFNRIHDGDSNYDRDRHEERMGGLLLWLTDRAVNIKLERNSSQMYARMFYAVSGLIGSIPIFNFLGDSYTAPMESSMIIMASFATLYVVKEMTSSTRSTGEWMAFNSEVRDSMKSTLVESAEAQMRKTLPKEYLPAQDPPAWIKRRIAIRGWIGDKLTSVKNACMAALGDKAPKWGRQADKSGGGIAPN